MDKWFGIDAEEHIDYIISTLEQVKLLRNGFFHKDNIEDSVIVEEVRNSTYLPCTICWDYLSSVKVIRLRSRFH